MKPPKYEPLKMGNPEHAKKYAAQVKRYEKWLQEKYREGEQIK